MLSLLDCVTLINLIVLIVMDRGGFRGGGGAGMHRIIFSEELKVRGKKYEKNLPEIVQKELKWPLH